MNDIATINIDKKTVEGIVERQMQAAIFSQLHSVRDELLQTTINKILTHKVDSSGRFSNSSYRDEQTLMEHLVNEQVKAVALEAVKNFFQKEKLSFEAEILKALTKDKSKIAKMAVSAMSETFSQQFAWKFSLNIEDKK